MCFNVCLLCICKYYVCRLGLGLGGGGGGGGRGYAQDPDKLCAQVTSESWLRHWFVFPSNCCSVIYLITADLTVDCLRVHCICTTAMGIARLWLLVAGMLCVMCWSVQRANGQGTCKNFSLHTLYITESVDSVCRDTTYTQYMLINTKKSLQISETVHL